MNKQSEKMIEGYLKEVKEKLPEWLKDDKDELNGVLAELEDHIRNKAMEVSKSEELSEESVEYALSSMGNPSKIAREYKKRGTPYVYITKELWPTYKNVVLIVFTVLASVFTFTFILNLISGNFKDAFNFAGYMLGFFASFTIITAIFVALSMEGYLPEDFISKEEKEKKEKELKKAEEMGMPISPKTGKPMKPFVNKWEKLIGGAIGAIIGIILIVQPVSGFFGLMDAEFRFYLLIIGVLSLIDAFTTIVRGVLGNTRVEIHQAIQIFIIVLKLIGIPILILILLQPEIVPIIYWNGSTFINVGIPIDFYDSFRITLGILTTIFSISIAANVYETVKLERYKL